MSNLQIRTAVAADAATIFDFIVQLAIYEKEPDAVQTTVDVLRAQLASPQPPFECVIAELGGQPMGFALFFQSYSTWRGAVGIYLEDLFVPERHRGRGVGGALLRHLAQLTLARGGARLEWAVLDWNEPAIGFYEAVGAVPMSEWTRFRLDGEALQTFAAL